MAHEDHLDDITIHPKGQTPCISPRSQPPAPEKYASDDSATESESESVMIKFIAERKKRKAQRALFAIDVVPPSDALDRRLGGNIENSPISHSASPPSIHASSQLLSDDTQALYLAGAPLSASDFSLQTFDADDSIQSMPPAMKDFMDMFDDEGSYPKDFPMDLRC